MMHHSQYFTAGQFAKLHGLSKQTILFYDKIGLLPPAYVEPSTGYRYYAPGQMELVDSIFILKEIGVPLEEIKQYLHERSPQNAVEMLQQQQTQLAEKIRNLQRIQDRLHAKQAVLERTLTLRPHTGVQYRTQPEALLYLQAVDAPYDLLRTDFAIKKLLLQLTEQQLPYNYMIGVTIPLAHLAAQEFVAADHVYTHLCQPLAQANCHVRPAGLYAVFYHKGLYREAGNSYRAALKQIARDGYTLCSGSYEDCLIDNLSARDEADYLTEIQIAVSK